MCDSGIVGVKGKPEQLTVILRDSLTMGLRGSHLSQLDALNMGRFNRDLGS